MTTITTWRVYFAANGQWQAEARLTSAQIEAITNLINLMNQEEGER